MTSEEFNTFKNRLFVMYPGLFAWLKDNSPDLQETLRSWLRRLERYTIEECFGVLASWEKRNEEPFKAYERDQLPAIVASVIDKQREKAAKAREAQQNRDDYDSAKRGELGPVAMGTVMDSQMAKARDLCIPIHKRFQDGEISREEYEQQRDEIIEDCFAQEERQVENHH